MASALVVSLVKYGLLLVLWLFVIAAVRTVRADLYGWPTGRPATARPATPPVVATASRRSTARRLVVTEGPLAGTALTLSDSPVTMGRADESTLVLTDDYASSHHARLAPGDGAWLLEDLGSTNGTYLGAAKVVRPTPVPLGQPIRIGKTVLELRR